MTHDSDADEDGPLDIGEPRDERPSLVLDMMSDLTVGLVAAGDDFKRGVVSDAFTMSLGCLCHVKEFASYSELTEGIVCGKVDLAWLPPVAFVRAQRLGEVRLLLAMQRGGHSTYSSALLGRRGVVDSLDDLKGRRVAWVDVWSAGGYLMARSLLRARGIDPDGVFGSQGFYESYGAVLAALRDGSADVGAAYCSATDDGTITRKPWRDEDDFTLLGVTEPIPSDVLCASDSVSVTLAIGIIESLLMEDNQARVAKALNASSLVPADRTTYTRLALVLRQELSGTDIVD